MEYLTTDVTVPDGTRLHVHQYQSDAPTLGVERAVLLVHGWPNSGRVWRPLAEALLLGGGVRLVAPDLRGFGQSDKPDAGYTCAQFADDVLAVADALDLTNYALVGHSMGGKIAQLAAARGPANLSALILLAPATLAGADPGEEKKAEQRAAHGDPAKIEALVSAMAAHQLNKNDSALLIEDGLQATPPAWNGWINVMRGEDFAGEAASIAVPTLVLAGARDPLRSEDALRQGVAQRIAGAQFATLPGVGHLPHLEDPVALAALLLNFLDASLSSTAAALSPTDVVP
jgi:pimeloyl-ACP methyl ester carboxylesterase